MELGEIRRSGEKDNMELGLPVVVTTGPGEESIIRRLRRTAAAYSPHHFPVSFLQLIPLLKKAHLMVGGDTGPFHLACALGTPWSEFSAPHRR